MKQTGSKLAEKAKGDGFEGRATISLGFPTFWHINTAVQAIVSTTSGLSLLSTYTTSTRDKHAALRLRQMYTSVFVISHISFFSNYEPLPQPATGIDVPTPTRPPHDFFPLQDVTVPYQYCLFHWQWLLDSTKFAPPPNGLFGLRNAMVFSPIGRLH